MTHDFIDISLTLIMNKRTIRVHEDVAREISLLPSDCLPFWFSTSSMQPLQAHLEGVEEKARPSSSAILCWIAANGSVARQDVERPCTPLPRSFAAGLGLPFSSDHASFHIPPQTCEAARTAGPSDRRPLLSLQRSSLGAVFDGLEALSSKPCCFPRSAAFSRSGRDRLLVAEHRHYSDRSKQTHSSLGLRPDSGHHLPGRAQRLGLAAVPFSSHQPVARQSGNAKEKSGRQNHA